MYSAFWRKIVKLSSAAVIGWALALPVLAANLNETVKNNLNEAAIKSGLTQSGNGDNRSILDLFGVYIALSLGFVGITFLVQVVHGGYLWMTAGGNDEKVKKAIGKITNGAIGAAVVFFAYIITYFLLSEFTTEAGIIYFPN